jgi:mono/diheme cytochrome c family protein
MMASLMTALRTSLAGTATIGIALWGLIGGAVAAVVDGFELAPRCLPSADGLTKEGERWWTLSPDPGNPVACATCHYDAVAVSAWAPSFPKWKPLPAPHSRVMTLLQANAEAVARHYRLDDPRPAAVAITAYLMWLARGAPVTPGTSAGQPVLPARLEALSASVERGNRAFQAGCRACHQVEQIAARALAFPRVTRGRAVSFEGFLEEHVSSSQTLTWDGAPVADLLAYLMSSLAGRTLPVTCANSLEVSR